jgi:hypothetical protein
VLTAQDAYYVALIDRINDDCVVLRDSIVRLSKWPPEVVPLVFAALTEGHKKFKE